MDPHFTNLFELSPDAEAGRLRVGLADEAGKGIRFTIPFTMVPSFVVGLAAQAGEIAKADRDAATAAMQIIDIDSVELALTDDGDPVLLMSFPNGLELPLKFQGGALSELTAALALLTTDAPARSN